MKAYLLALFLLAISGAANSAEQPALKCEVGPATKTYGSSQWLVYSCADNLSVVIVSAPGNPAMPFFFMFAAGPNGYQLHGEGASPKAATEPAFNELRELQKEDILNLVALTKEVGKKK